MPGENVVDLMLISLPTWRRLTYAGDSVKQATEYVIYQNRLYTILEEDRCPITLLLKHILTSEIAFFFFIKTCLTTNYIPCMFIRKLLDGLAAIMFLFKGNFGTFRSVWKAHTGYYKALKNLKPKRELVKDT